MFWWNKENIKKNITKFTPMFWCVSKEDGGEVVEANQDSLNPCQQEDLVLPSGDEGDDDEDDNDDDEDDDEEDDDDDDKEEKADKVDSPQSMWAGRYCIATWRMMVVLMM